MFYFGDIPKWTWDALLDAFHFLWILFTYNHWIVRYWHMTIMWPPFWWCHKPLLWCKHSLVAQQQTTVSVMCLLGQKASGIHMIAQIWSQQLFYPAPLMSLHWEAKRVRLSMDFAPDDHNVTWVQGRVTCVHSTHARLVMFTQSWCLGLSTELLIFSLLHVCTPL